MVYVRLFTILLAGMFMGIVFYGDLNTVKALAAGLCGGFVAVVAAHNRTGSRLEQMQKRVEKIEERLSEGWR